MWHWPAKQASGFMVFMGCLGLARPLQQGFMDRLEPSYFYFLLGGLVLVGAGCAMLVYHIRNDGVEDIAVKKKIVLVGIAGSTSIASLGILHLLNIL